MVYLTSPPRWNAEVGAAVIDEAAVDGAFLQRVGHAARRHADRGAAQGGDEALDRHRGEADAQAVHVRHRPHRLACGVQIAGLVREQIKNLQALIFGREESKHLRIVQRLDADLGAADHIGQLDDLGQREAAGRRAVQEPGDIGNAGARIVGVVLHRPHLARREDRDIEPAAGFFLQFLHPIIEIFGENMRRRNKVAELEIVGGVAARNPRRGNERCASEQRRVELSPVHRCPPIDGRAALAGFLIDVKSAPKSSGRQRSRRSGAADCRRISAAYARHACRHPPERRI